jgi:CheY-like chemotaxis protein
MHRKVFLNAVAIAGGRITIQDPGNQPAEAGKAPAPLPREEARKQRRLILIAEDNEINQKVILLQLTLLGHTADIAGNGREALKLWQSGDYSVLLTDLHMPEMDGYELTTAIRGSESLAAKTAKPHIPIIAFTANALKGEAEHCLAVGMDDYLSKPVQLINLKVMLEKWLPLAGKAVPVGRVSTRQTSVGLKPDLQSTDRLSDLQEPETPAAVAPVEMTSTPEGLSAVGRVSTRQTSVGLKPDLQAAVPVDVNVLKALVGDDEAIIAEFLHDFRISAAKIATELRTACAADQAAAAGAQAHKLKSSARAVGAMHLGELCAEMEQAGKDGDMKALKTRLPGFEQELVSVERFLDSY